MYRKKCSKSCGNHPVFSFMNQRCGDIQTITSWSQWRPQLISTGKSPAELTQPRSDPKWKQFIFQLRVSFTAMQHFTSTLAFRFSTTYLVLSWQQRARCHSSSSTFLSSLQHKPLSALGHKLSSDRGLIIKRQNKLLSTWTGDPKKYTYTNHTDLG